MAFDLLAVIDEEGDYVFVTAHLPISNALGHLFCPVAISVDPLPMFGRVTSQVPDLPSVSLVFAVVFSRHGEIVVPD